MVERYSATLGSLPKAALTAAKHCVRASGTEPAQELVWKLEIGAKPPDAFRRLKCGRMVG